MPRPKSHCRSGVMRAMDAQHAIHPAEFRQNAEGGLSRTPALRITSSYSCRNATIGSMREARRAGTRHASAAIPIRVTDTTAAVVM
jgi:hypothetical protein